MPLYKIDSIGKESAVGIWHIQETEEALAYEAFEQCPEELVSQQKRLEWLAGRALIKKLVETYHLPYAGILKDEFGKPYLRELSHHISLSHSYPFVAAQIDPSQSVGIDLEQPKKKLLTIASRVLSPEELENAGTDIVKHCVYWCAKETMYKMYGKRGLHFSNQLNIEPFSLAENGLLKGMITAINQKLAVNLNYTIEKDFVLVYTQPILK